MIKKYRTKYDIVISLDKVIDFNCEVIDFFWKDGLNKIVGNFKTIGNDLVIEKNTMLYASYKVNNIYDCIYNNVCEFISRGGVIWMKKYLKIIIKCWNG